MDTIYNFLHKNEPIEKGVVEIIQTYDETYFDIALDGEVIEQVYKNSYIPTILSRKFIKQCCKLSGKTEDELIFVRYDFYDFGDDYDPSGYFDTNDYGSYEDQFNLIKQHIVDDKAINHFKSKYMNYRYVGIDALENYLA